MACHVLFLTYDLNVRKHSRCVSGFRHRREKKNVKHPAHTASHVVTIVTAMMSTTSTWPRRAVHITWNHMLHMKNRNRSWIKQQVIDQFSCIWFSTIYSTHRCGRWSRELLRHESWFLVKIGFRVRFLLWLCHFGACGIYFFYQWNNIEWEKAAAAT